MSDAVLILLGINLVCAIAVALVMALRLPVRRLFGPRIAYGLWSLLPLAGVALLLPARVVTVAVPAAPATPQMVLEAGVQAANSPAGPGLLPFAVMLWIAGGLASLGWLVWRQVEFGRAARHGLAGPAVIGLLKPRIVTPFDFGWRYTPREQLVVLAHEATHIARRDTLANAAMALARCVNWFNPAIHIAAHYLRIDQEFACDAQVVAAHPTARRSYAEAMLKTQLDVRPLPVGCYWPAQAAHPLAERIRLLSRQDPGRARRRFGTALVAVLGVVAAGSVWAARPAHVVQVSQSAPAKVAPRTVAPAVKVAVRPAASSTQKVADDPRATPASAPALPADPVAAAAAQALADAGAPATESASLFPVARITKVRPVARQSAVEPGSAVRVLATMTDPDGVPITSDLTAFGSQSVYRAGYFSRGPSRYSLFTSVFQEGDRLWVTASASRRFDPRASGTIVLASGQTGQITLGDGQVVTVTPTLRRETPEEVEDGKRAMRNISPMQVRVKPAPWIPNGA